MESSHSQQHNIHSTKKRKRGRPRKEEVVRSSNSTSQHTSLAQEKPVGRPRKVQINPTSDNCKIMTGTSNNMSMVKYHLAFHQRTLVLLLLLNNQRDHLNLCQSNCILA